MRKTLVCGVVIFAISACTGSNPTTPSSSSAVDPFVTIQLTYDCSPCFPDRDNYQLAIDGSAGEKWVWVDNPLLEHNTVTWSGRLAPGRHVVEMKVTNIPLGKAAVLTFSSTGSGNTGGVRPHSIAVDLLAAPVNVTIGRCEVVSTPKIRPNNVMDSLFIFDVVLGSPGSVC
jgi:hypothetical protein